MGVRKEAGISDFENASWTLFFRFPPHSKTGWNHVERIHTYERPTNSKPF